MRGKCFENVLNNWPCFVMYFYSPRPNNGFQFVSSFNSTQLTALDVKSSQLLLHFRLMKKIIILTAALCVLICCNYFHRHFNVAHAAEKAEMHASCVHEKLGWLKFCLNTRHSDSQIANSIALISLQTLLSIYSVRFRFGCFQSRESLIKLQKQQRCSMAYM